MNNNTVIIDLLNQMRLAKDHCIVFAHDDLAQWPSVIVNVMRSRKVIVKSGSAKEIVCDGCEEACLMPVDFIKDSIAKLHPFVVCDKRDDINRVPVAAEKLVQWQCGIAQIVQLLCQLFRFTYDSKLDLSQKMVRLGMLKGRNGRRWILLNTDHLSLEINHAETPLEDILFLDHGDFVIDQHQIGVLINAVPSNISKRYESASEQQEKSKLKTKAQYQDWQDAYLKLKKQHPGRNDTWISKQIAKLPIANGKSSETIRKNMK